MALPTRRSALALLALPLFVANGGVVSGQELAKLRVLAPANDGFRALFYGVRAGIFRRYGVEVEPTIANSGAAAAAALAGGAADVAYTNTATVILAHRRGIPMRVLVPAALYMSEKPNSLMLVLKDSAIRSGRDLNGKVVGALALSDLAALATLAWIDQTGGDSRTVRMIEAPASAVVAFLLEGRADAITVIEPGGSLAIASGKVRVLTQPLDVLGKRFQGGAYVALASAVEKNPDLMSRFVRAMHESQVYTNSHLAETVDLVASYSGISPDVISRSIRMIDPEYVEPRMIQPVIDLLAKYGQLDKGFSAEEIVASVALKPPTGR